MREETPRVGISAKTLKSTPDTGQSGKESKESGMRRITLRRVIPIFGVEAEEQLDVLATS